MNAVYARSSLDHTFTDSTDLHTRSPEEPAVSSREIYLHDDVTSALIRRIADEKENLKLDALELLLHEAISGPKMALNVPRPYNPVWEQDKHQGGT